MGSFRIWETNELVIKRTLDLVGAIIGLILFSPLMVIVALLIRLDSPGPALFLQYRIGRGGRAFKMLKFRTMQLGAETAHEQEFQQAPNRRVTPHQFQNLLHDPRLTRIGRSLRRSSIDELPQLWNVLKGEMSLVGPRPFLPVEQEHYGDTSSAYILARPGMTGLWQVSGRSRLSFTERVQLDTYYIHHWSLWLDIRILVRTIWVVVRGEGAY
jgi:Undecaprenyl-phosphate galactose phosphotransferase WbaP